jgi:FixJ family two-component response regulator
MPYTLCFSRPRRKRVASVDDTTTTVVGIIGDDPLVSRILGLLLEGAGYEASPLEEAAVLEDPSTALAGVDLVLFMPLLGDERKGELLGVMKGDQATAAVPLISLSTDMKAELDERTDSVLPWPWSTQALVRAIERAVHARGGGEPS